MANKNRNLIISYFPSEAAADDAAKDLIAWEGEQDGVKLGGIGLITLDGEGELHTSRVGARATGTGAKWGLIAGAVAGVLSGGLTLAGGALFGLVAGAATGALFRKRIGMTNVDEERLLRHLQNGGAALAVMADDHEVEPTRLKMSSLGGQVEQYYVPSEAADELEAERSGDVLEESNEIEAAEAAITPAPEMVVIHYQRSDGDYEGWGLHLWEGYPSETAWEHPLMPDGRDDYGIYFRVPVAEGATGLAYILHKGDEKQVWDDQYIDFATDGREVWLAQA